MDGESERYEIERLLDRRIGGQVRERQPYYLVKWKGWGHEHNGWRSKKELWNGTELIRDYDDDHPWVQA